MRNLWIVDDSGETYTVTFHVPPQILLHPEWESMAWDHALKLAHENGVIPVGPIHIETKSSSATVGLVEGQPMLIHKMAAAAAGLGLEVVEVTATMMVGSRIEL